MRLGKTEKGIQIIKDRSINLTLRQRGAFILCDGRQQKETLLANALKAGINEADFQSLLDLALIEEIQDVPDTSVADAAEAFASLAPVDRFKEAYPLAVKLTGSLGLRGFRLSLAVERSSSYEDLCTVAPALEKAVSRVEYQPLHKALFGPLAPSRSAPRGGTPAGVLRPQAQQQQSTARR